jgi:hypothetical protein
MAVQPLLNNSLNSLFICLFCSEKRPQVQDAAAAAQLHLQETAEMESVHLARQAQAQADLRVAQLLDSVSGRTGQDVADLDRAAVIADHQPGAKFECPILYIECDKVLPL